MLAGTWAYLCAAALVLLVLVMLSGAGGSPSSFAHDLVARARHAMKGGGRAVQVDPRLNQDVYGYMVRCIRIWDHTYTDVGSCSYCYRVRCKAMQVARPDDTHLNSAWM
jgi:hypothetical protein